MAYCQTERAWILGSQYHQGQRVHQQQEYNGITQRNPLLYRRYEFNSKTSQEVFKTENKFAYNNNLYGTFNCVVEVCVVHLIIFVVLQNIIVFKTRT
jgi:hypothetical protein